MPWERQGGGRDGDAMQSTPTWNALQKLSSYLLSTGRGRSDASPAVIVAAAD